MYKGGLYENIVAETSHKAGYYLLKKLELFKPLRYYGLGGDRMYRNINDIIKELRAQANDKGIGEINFDKIEKFIIDTGYRGDFDEELFRKFKYCITSEYKGGRVAEVKIKYLDNIVNQASKCEKITKIIVFGSATTNRCTYISDIDIAVYGIESKKSFIQSKEYKDFLDAILRFDLDQEYDFFYFCDNEDHEGRIFEDIAKGLVIYEKIISI